MADFVDVATTIEPITQRGLCDCAVACLAMYLGLPYVAVAHAVPQLARVMREGMSTRQIVNVGKRLGVPLLLSKSFDLEEDSGILYVCDTEHGHAVLLWKGGAFNPADGLFWKDADTLLKTYGFAADTLITRREA